MQKILLVGFILLISSVCCIGSSINELETKLKAKKDKKLRLMKCNRIRDYNFNHG